MQGMQASMRVNAQISPSIKFHVPRLKGHWYIWEELNK